MELFGKDLSEDVVIVAEVGVNHEGNINKALELVHMAAESGADAVKFQTYEPFRYASTSDMERFQRVSSFSLSNEDFVLLSKEAESLGIGFFSTPLDESSVQFVSSISPVIKIASPDMNFEPTVRAAASTGKPLIISTGMALPEEIDKTLSWVQDEIGSDVPLNSRVVLLHCASAYPTPIEEINLLSIPYLAERYPVYVGFSDHTIGLDAARASVALGATVIEKHFTDNKEDRDFRDHELSADPDDLKTLVDDVARTKLALGVKEKTRSVSETPNLIPTRKGVVAASDLPEGKILERNDLMFARPSSEIPAERINELIGKTLKVPLQRGNLVPSDTL